MFVSTHLQQLRRYRAFRADDQADHGVCRRTPAIGRTAGIEDPDTAVAPQLWQVRVAVDDGRTASKPGDQTRLAPCASSRVVYDAESRVPHLDDPFSRQERSERGLVHVPVHRDDRSERAQVFEHALGHEIARVDDQVGRGELTYAIVGKPPRASGQMRVGEDGDARR
jgi:hypothetical protein